METKAEELKSYTAEVVEVREIAYKVCYTVSAASKADAKKVLEERFKYVNVTEIVLEDGKHA